MASVPASKQTHPLLVSYLSQLALHPLRTKATTSAILCFLQEVLGSNLSRSPVKRPSPDSPVVFHLLARAHVDLKAVKMALYGFLVSAPLSHYLVGALQKAFAGKSSSRAKVAQILANNLIVSPIQTVAFLSSMAIINGSKSFGDVVKTVKAGFFSVIRISWIVSPLSLTIAQKFIPMELWVPFFNLIGFVMGTYFNMRVKQLRLKQLKKEKEKRGGDGAR